MRAQSTVALVAVLACAGTAARSGAQTSSAAASMPAFEVASVRRNASGDADGSIGAQKSRYVVRNVPLRFIIQVAHEVQPFRLVGGPTWIDAERYDIQGVAPGDASETELRAMMRTLLADRFKLVLHTEPRTVAGFALVRARPTGSLGPQLRAHPEPCPTEVAPARSTDPFANLPPCGRAGGTDRLIRMSAQPLTELAFHLSRRLGRPVVDRTGLAGPYDVRLEWTARSSASLATSPDDDGLSVFTALQEQLGLKLQSERVDTEHLVIDRVERPTED
jgi:uncharacterized protein (TIGR03435 family)